MGVLKNIVGLVADRIQTRLDEGLEKLATRLDTPETPGPAVPEPWQPEGAAKLEPEAAMNTAPAKLEAVSRATDTSDATAEATHVPPGPLPRCVPADLEALRAVLRPRGRPLIIHHWATWCDSCEEELPRIERLYQALGGTADLVGVSWDLFEPSGPPERVAGEVSRFAARTGISWPNQLFTGTPEALFEGLELSFQFIPQTRVVDAEGRELRHFGGVMTEADLEEVLALVKKG